MTDNVTEETEVTNVDEAPEGVRQTHTPEETEGVEATDTPDSDMFPRDYVEKLRVENAKYRQRAGESDSLAKRLHTELVRATGRLADPTDLPFDPEHLDDEGVRLTEALDALLDAKPHLATRRPAGDIGQGQRGPAPSGFSLLDTLKGLT